MSKPGKAMLARSAVRRSSAAQEESISSSPVATRTRAARPAVRASASVCQTAVLVVVRSDDHGSAFAMEPLSYEGSHELYRLIVNSGYFRRPALVDQALSSSVTIRAV